MDDLLLASSAALRKVAIHGDAYYEIAEMLCECFCSNFDENTNNFNDNPLTLIDDSIGVGFI